MANFMETPARAVVRRGEAEREGERIEEGWRARAMERDVDVGSARSRARALGWMSVGLGAAELVLPSLVARMVGLPRGGATKGLLRMMGVREITTGVGLLRGRDLATWMWGRVAGDALDLVLLGGSMASSDAGRGRLAVATAAVAGIAAIDVKTAMELGGVPAGTKSVDVKKAITINRSPEDVYRFWRDFRNLSRFTAHLESVELIDDRRSRWRAIGPAGVKVEWEAEITEDVPNERLAWRTIAGSSVEHRGEVRFVRAPGGRGTEVHVHLEYHPPASRAGVGVAKLFGREPSQQIDGDLRRFKQVMETGEVVHSDASIHRGPHPARPGDGARTEGVRAGGVRRLRTAPGGGDR